jgi:hypothetical protein
MIKIDKIKLQQAGLLIAALAVMFIVINTISGSQWMLFYDKSISGTVIDAETNKPLEGAIVVGMWRLSQFPSEGSGGYAKVSLVTTDKEGKFTIPCWITFNPWKLYAYLQDLAPEIAIYKPGYRFHWSHKKSRLGFPLAYEISAEERRKLYEKYTINPARLVKIYTDEDRLENYDDWSSKARFPEKYYSSHDSEIIAKALKEELSQLSDKNSRKRRLLRNVEEL